MDLLPKLILLDELTGGDRNMLFVAKGAAKGAALRILQKERHTSPSQVVANINAQVFRAKLDLSDLQWLEAVVMWMERRDMRH